MSRFAAVPVFVLLFAAALNAQSAAAPIWDFGAGFYDNLFPSFIVATATVKSDAEADSKVLGDPVGQILIAVNGGAAKRPLTVRIVADDVMEPAEWKGELADGAQTYEVRPQIAWKFKELLKCRQVMPLALKVTLSSGAWSETRIKTVTLRSINDCPTLVAAKEAGGEMSFEVVRWMYAAYVNEDHPWIDTLLKEALKTGVVDHFDGYQSKDEARVRQQVFAIWKALQVRGISYSSISTVAATHEKVLSQQVRFLDETVRSEQANCIDGAALLAAAVRKIGLAPTIVLQPGHAYLAVALDPEGKTSFGIETTVVGTVSKDKKDKETTYERLKIGWKPFDQASRDSYEIACSIGTKALSENLGKFVLRSEPFYQLVDIAKARAAGLKPLPYNASDKSVSEPPAKKKTEELEKLLIGAGAESRPGVDADKK